MPLSLLMYARRRWWARRASDADERVRGQAMFALGELASNCQPEMSSHAAQARPLAPQCPMLSA